MNMEEIGFTVAYLLRHRVVETQPSNRRNNDDEQTVAKILNLMSLEERRTLEEIFAGMRLIFVDFDWSTIPDLPRDNRVFLLARDIGNGDPVSVLDQKVIIEGMRGKGNESKREAASWFVHLWLVHLDLIYTDNGRSPPQMQNYPEGMFDFDVFLAKVREHFEDLRQSLDRKEIPQNAVFYTFEKASHAEGERRCRRFVNLMLEAGLLTTIAKDTYQQTLLSAFEIKRNYSRGLQQFVTDTNTNKQHIATSILTGIDTTAQKEQDNVSDR